MRKFLSSGQLCAMIGAICLALGINQSYVEAMGCQWCVGNCASFTPVSVAPAGPGCSPGVCNPGVVSYCEDDSGNICGCRPIYPVPPLPDYCDCF
jgi:hypothetical protein